MTKTELQSALAEAPNRQKDRWSISRYAQRHRLWSALHYAVHYGEAAIAKLLFYAGADPNARGYGGCTPLSLAMNQGSKEAQAVITHIRRKTLPKLKSSKANKSGMSEAIAPLKPLETSSRKGFWRILNPS
jgi:ankyrin repeat protein